VAKKKRTKLKDLTREQIDEALDRVADSASTILPKDTNYVILVGDDDFKGGVWKGFGAYDIPHILRRSADIIEIQTNERN